MTNDVLINPLDGTIVLAIATESGPGVYLVSIGQADFDGGPTRLYCESFLRDRSGPVTRPSSFELRDIRLPVMLAANGRTVPQFYDATRATHALRVNDLILSVSVPVVATVVPKPAWWDNVVPFPSAEPATAPAVPGEP